MTCSLMLVIGCSQQQLPGALDDAISHCNKSHSPASTFNRTPFSARLSATSVVRPEVAIFRDAYLDSWAASSSHAS